MIAIREIAARAGVSTGTVSRVLNHHDCVAPNTCERVLQEIGRVDWRPNSSAQNLRRSRRAEPTAAGAVEGQTPSHQKDTSSCQLSYL